MQYIWTLKEMVEIVEDFAEWLTKAGDKDPVVMRCHDIVLSAHPYATVEGLNTQVQMWQLSTLRSCTWLNCQVVMGFAERLAQRSGGVCSALATATMEGRVYKFPDHTKHALRKASTDLIFVPINIGVYHWTAMAINRITKTIEVYDPLGEGAGLTRLERLARATVAELFRDYKVVARTAPVQKDGHSCGVYVGWFFEQMVGLSEDEDWTINGLVRRRVKMVSTILSPPINI